MIEGLLSEQEAAVVADLRKAKAAERDPAVAAEAALTRLAKARQHTMGGSTTFEKAYAEVLATRDGRQLYEIAANKAAIGDPEALLASLAKIAS